MVPGSLTNHFRLPAFILLAMAWLGLATQGLAIEWANLTPRQKHLVTFVMPPSSPTIWGDGEVEDFLRRHGTRSGTYHAVGMLYRNQGADVVNALRIIRNVLKLQHHAPGNKIHGTWRTGLDTDREDENWREFVGTGLIVAREHFGALMDADLIRDIDSALVRAAEGAARRNVSAHYSNIALMSAFLLDYTGHITSNDKFREQGKAKAREIFELFSQHKTFVEFNSPTYYGIDLMGLAMWRDLAPSPEFRTWAKEIESTFWQHIARYYHAGLKNLCGPYARSYGMNMTDYVTPTGLAIAMGLEDHLPLPDTRERSFEWAYAPLLALLNVHPPDDLLPEFKTFSGPREILDKISFMGQTFQAQALIEDDWMMGAATGMGRRWDQHFPGTVHWQAGKAVGWLLVHGENAAEVRIIERKMHVFLTHPDPKHPLRILIQVPGSDTEGIGQNVWSLPGMKFEIQTPLPAPAIRIMKDKRLGKVIEVSFPVPATHPATTAALVLAPMKKD